MRVWMQAWKAEVMKRKLTPSNIDAGACVASTAFLSWHSRSIFQVLRGAELERCSCFWKKGTSELWDLWWSLLATQSMKKVCPSQCSVYPERFVKETSFTDSPAGGRLSTIAHSRWREMSSRQCSAYEDGQQPVSVQPSRNEASFKSLMYRNKQCCWQLLPTFQAFHHFWKPRIRFDNGFITIISNCLPLTHSCT